MFVTLIFFLKIKLKKKNDVKSILHYLLFFIFQNKFFTFFSTFGYKKKTNLRKTEKPFP